MSDKKLLKYAANAAGIEGRLRACVTGLKYDLIIDENDKEWNPLDDDGDALRLAVKLELLVDIGKGVIGVTQASTKAQDIDESYAAGEECPYAATRRAIVRAAAEIGRSMKDE